VRVFKIAYNDLGLAAGGDLEAPTFNLPQMQIKSTKLQFTTEPPLAANPC
jgi:hypothetical protein